ncbi:MAG: acyl-CoA dehydrogenase family protein [Deltaproteobacteria bacterium]|nr:acyl-CoA dehydrogenase family protein [Deltaproteobacteria bacterium]
MTDTANALSAAPAGGSFLIEPAGAHRIFSVEDLSEEQRAMALEASRFMEKNVLPKERWLESKDGKASKDMVKLVKKACDQGFALVEVPEKFGGLGADKVTSLLIADKLGNSGDFCVTWGAHSGIGMAPILYFGNDEQKHKFASRIAAGEVISCYALSEPGSGSDALAARTVAKLNEEGTHYILNGTKQWITNAAWADVGIVFAKVDGDKFTAFIVERGTPGFTHGTEEHKLGLRGSSTCQLIFTDSPIPVENVLGEVGKGHKVAFNTLNLGRYKLAGGVLSLGKRAFAEALQYAKDRKQFNTRVADFGGIREQIADSMVGLYLGESLVYRVAGYIDARLAGLDANSPDYVEKTMAAIEEYAIEASIAKVYGSEALDRLLDRALQWHGGYGFVEDYNVEKFVRDARVNRIFEGTNEINRMLVPGTLFKRTMQKRLGLFAALADLEKRLAGGDLGALPAEGDVMGNAQVALQRLKWLSMLMAQATSTRFGMALDGEQETLMQLSNLLIDCYAVDSAVCRTLQSKKGDEIAEAVACIAAVEALDRAGPIAKRMIHNCFAGEAAAPWLAKIAKIQADLPIALLPLRRKVAAEAVDRSGYKLSAY